MKTSFKFLAPLFCVMGAASALSACAGADFSMSSPARIAAQAVPMPTGNSAVPPAGVMGFCIKYLAECSTKPAGSVVVTLDDQRRHQLETVQARVNTAIAPRSMPGHEWDYASHGYGECNQYALEKRRDLIALGWPREALLLTAALTERGEGHLVLVARTSAGDLVLDNRSGPVVDWSYLPYHWVEQQRASSLTQWVSLETVGRAVASVPPARVSATNEAL
jgi:predicted transglutaminase-like cysteine proteinase